MNRLGCFLAEGQMNGGATLARRAQVRQNRAREPTKGAHFDDLVFEPEGIVY
jgi:hypothetical protein